MDSGPPVTEGRHLALHAALAALVVVASAVQLFSHDVWWHLAAGDWILANHAIPRADPFTSTSAGEPWVDHEWGFQLLLAQVHALLGVPGLVLLRMVAVLASAALLLALLRRRAVSPHVAAALVALAVTAGRLRLQVRPELVSLALLLVVVAACTGPTPLNFSRRRRFFGLAALFALWTNLHPGFLLGLAVLGAWTSGGVADRALEALRGGVHAPEPGELRHRGLTLAACTAASCLNPWGPRLLWVPLEIGRTLHSAGVVNPEWEPPLPTLQPLFFSLAALTAGLLALACRRLPVSTLLVGLVLLAYALRFSRGTGLFSLAAPLLLVDALRALAPDRPLIAAALRPSPRASLAIAAVLAAAASGLTVRPDPLRLGFGVDPRFAPVGAAELLLRTRPEPEIYNEIGDGGYLLWSLRPDFRVFLDGRNEVHARLLADWARSQEDPERWADLLARHRVNTAVVRHSFAPLYPTGQPFPETFNRAFFPQREWALIYWDDRNQVLLRRTPTHGALIDELEYRCLNPEDLANTAARMGHDPAFSACVHREVARALREQPGSSVAEACRRALGSGNLP